MVGVGGAGVVVVAGGGVIGVAGGVICCAPDIVCSEMYDDVDDDIRVPMKIRHKTASTTKLHPRRRKVTIFEEDFCPLISFSRSNRTESAKIKHAPRTSNKIIRALR